MSSSGGGDQSPLIGVGLAIAVLLFAGGPLNDLRFCRGDDCPLAEHEQASEAPEGQRAEPAKSAEQWAAETCAIAAQANGRGSEEQVQRDLCAQFRAAAAAERTAVFAEEQVFIGWWGLSGLGATVIIAVMAWLAARSSAKADNVALELTRKQLDEARIAAEEQSSKLERQVSAQQDVARAGFRTAQVMRETGQAQVRAYVSLGLPRGPSEGDRVFVIPIVNTGSTPARALRWEYRLTLHETADMEVGRSLTTDTATNPTYAEIPGGGKPAELAILHSQATWLRSMISKIGPNRPANFLMIVRYLDVFGRYFELRERMELGARSGNDSDPDELNVTHVRSRERQITEAEYNEPIQLMPPE